MSIAENIARIRENIAAAAREAGRDPGEILLVGASKMNGAAACREAIAAGIDALGENRVQEMTAKLQENAYAGAPLHFIGHLQRNKVKDVLLEVNIGQETAKSGFFPAQMLAGAEAALSREHIRVLGLMAIPPAEADRETNLRYFDKIRAIFIDMDEKVFHNKLQHLSMGMSGDYADAIRAGATMVRIGTAVFGSRHYTEE